MVVVVCVGWFVDCGCGEVMIGVVFVLFVCVWLLFVFGNMLIVLLIVGIVLFDVGG